MLVEQQSSWSSNIVVRCLLYLAQTYQKYIEQTKQNVYKSTKIKLPKPELFIIYTGTRKQHPESLCLSEESFDGEESAVDVRVKMIYDGKTGDIINQYVTFTRIYNEQVKLHRKTRKAVLKIIRICKDQNILKEYLENREKEVVNIMMMLFDEEYILKTYIESEIQEASEKTAKEVAKKAAKKATEKVFKRLRKRQKLKQRQLQKKLYYKGNSIEDIADILDISQNDIERGIEDFSSRQEYAGFI